MSQEKKVLPIVIALIGLFGTLGAAVIGILPDLLPDSTAHRSTSENSTTEKNIPNSLPSTVETIPTPNPTPPKSTSSPSQSEPAVSLPILERQSSQTWEGIFNENNYRSYQMVLHIEKVSGTTFQGKLHWPTLRNSFTEINGRAIKDFGDVLEQSKWNLIDGFNGSITDGTWLTFTETKLLQGSNIHLNGVYYAHLKDDGTIRGIYFLSERNSQPTGNFFIELER